MPFASDLFLPDVTLKEFKRVSTAESMPVLEIGSGQNQNDQSMTNPHLRTPLNPLPIDAVLPTLLAALKQSNSVVLQAPTGAGKTTRVPPAILDAGLAGDGEILLLEPRRLAARAAARRMSSERGSNLGEEIGYQVRFDQKCGRKTRLLAITDGILLRRLQDDPFLESVSGIVFDEFHERSLNVDLTLAMARRVQQTVRPDLKLIVMSATLSAGPVAEYLGNCPVITSEGRLYPVEIRYRPGISNQPMVDQVVSTVGELLDETPGDLLVFLPGVREIQQASRQLTGLAAEQGLSVMPLYGDLSPEQQDRVLSPQSQRKVVLSTNVAETSVTIDGITGVVDSGQVRQLQFDPGLGLDRLVLTKISQASADQRAGRAGRTRPGVCVRLWMEREHRGLSLQTEPEIRRVDLAGPVLELLCWGEADVAAFPWFEAPRAEAIEQALSLLERLGAVHSSQPTDLGRQMVRLPVHPRLARLLLEANRLGITDRAAWAAALLTERDPFERTDSNRRGTSLGPTHYSPSDILDRVQALEEFAAHGRVETSLGTLHSGGARSLQQAQQQLVRLVNDDISRKRSDRASAPPHTKGGQGGLDSLPAQPRKPIHRDEALLRALLTAYPDRVARRREPLGRKGIMVGGRGIRLADSSLVLQCEMFLCIDTDAGQGEVFVRQASALERDWLNEELIEISTDVAFDATLEKITVIRRTRYLELILEEASIPPPPNVDITQALVAAARENFERVFPSDEPEVTNFVARVRCLNCWLPDSGLPQLSDEDLHAVLPHVATGCRSFADLRKSNWLNALKNCLTYQQQQFLDREAPERIKVPSGSQVTVHYEVGRPPILAVRIQELFGLAETPRIAAGRVPVLLHLLGPNYRPQQITDDLKSFWNNTYPEVRKELRRRYPKHSWPEDPWTAQAERKPGRRT